jgi:hypothetical protein
VLKSVAGAGRCLCIWHSGETGNGVRVLCVDSLVLGSVEAYGLRARLEVVL